MRERRRRSVEAEALRAPVKNVFSLVLFIFPVLLVIVLFSAVQFQRGYVFYVVFIDVVLVKRQEDSEGWNVVKMARGLPHGGIGFGKKEVI